MYIVHIFATVPGSKGSPRVSFAPGCVFIPPTGQILDARLEGGPTCWENGRIWRNPLMRL